MSSFSSRYSKSQDLNVRRSYVDMPPLASSLSFNFSNLGSAHSLTYFSNQVELKINKRGCSEGCADELSYVASELDLETNVVKFDFDDRFLALCPGRYEGIVSIGCVELACRLDFQVGQQICFDNIETESADLENAFGLKDHCCSAECEEKCEGKCKSVFNAGVCGKSQDCDTRKITVDFQVSDKENAMLNAWIAENEGSCCPDGE